MWRPCGVLDDTYQKDMSIIRTWQQWSLLIAAITLTLLLPLFAPYFLISFINYVCVTVVVVMGLQVVMGFCGQISFGQPAFMAVGAFSSAILIMKFGVSFWLALPLSGIVAGIVGLIGGAPSLRIKGFYLAMATIAIHAVIMWLILHLKMTGGSQGLASIPPHIGSFEFDTDESMYYIIVLTTIIMTYAARNIERSRIGRALVAIRDNDLAAEVMGINLYYYKLLAFFISCFYAGVAGCLWTHLTLYAHPEQYTLMHALTYVGMTIVGGLGSIPGVFFGVVTLLLLDEFVMALGPFLAGIFPWLGTAPAAAMGVTAFGLVLVLFLIFEPRGIAHKWEIFKASYRLFPFIN